jgi:hypothetical protein
LCPLLLTPGLRTHTPFSLAQLSQAGIFKGTFLNIKGKQKETNLRKHEKHKNSLVSKIENSRISVIIEKSCPAF